MVKFLLYHGPFNWFLTYGIRLPIRTLDEAAESEIFALTKGQASKYYRNMEESSEMSPLVEEDLVRDQLWKMTLDLLKEKGYEAV